LIGKTDPSIDRIVLFPKATLELQPDLEC
jgi:hypothetical protein